jgi:hypothetical protein
MGCSLPGNLPSFPDAVVCIDGTPHEMYRPHEQRCILSAHARESLRAIANGGLVIKGVVRFVMVFMKNIWAEFFFDLS